MKSGGCLNCSFNDYIVSESYSFLIMFVMFYEEPLFDPWRQADINPGGRWHRGAHGGLGSNLQVQEDIFGHF